MSRIDAGLLLVIIAAVVLCLMIAVIPPRPDQRAAIARAEAEAICRSIAGTGPCNATELPAPRTELDPWDEPYRVECHDDRVVVRSSGRDGQLGTSDDLVHVCPRAGLPTPMGRSDR